MKIRFKLCSLFVLIAVVAISLSAWERFHPKHSVYSHSDFESLLGGSSFEHLAGGSMVELKRIAMQERYASVRVTKQGSDCYSEFSIDEAKRLLEIIDLFQPQHMPFDPTEVLDAPVFGEVEIQYVLREDGVLRMPISIEIIDDHSMRIGFTFVTTTDPQAKETVSRILQLANKTLNANPYYKFEKK